MVTYRGLPAPVICDFLSREQSRAHYAAGTEFQIGEIRLCSNTGTYVDSSFHRYADGTDEYFEGHPFLTADAAEHLVEHGAVLVGIGFRFSAAPVKVKGMGTFPVRAYATLDRS